jgi:hypothetical protein
VSSNARASSRRASAIVVTSEAACVSASTERTWRPMTGTRRSGVSAKDFARALAVRKCAFASRRAAASRPLSTVSTDIVARIDSSRLMPMSASSRARTSWSAATASQMAASATPQPTRIRVRVEMRRRRRSRGAASRCRRSRSAICIRSPWTHRPTRPLTGTRCPEPAAARRQRSLQSRKGT